MCSTDGVCLRTAQECTTGVRGLASQVYVLGDQACVGVCRMGTLGDHRRAGSDAP
jgi:hypothetical protein